MTLQPPPTDQPILELPDPPGGGQKEEGAGVPTLPWILFFNQLFNGDAGEAWTPLFAGLTIVGGAARTSGRVYRLSRYLSLFVAVITPPDGGNISGTAGAYAINNFPLIMQGDGVCFAVSGNLGTVSGMCERASNLIFPPTISAVTLPITIIGIVEAS